MGNTSLLNNLRHKKLLLVGTFVNDHVYVVLLTEHFKIEHFLSGEDERERMGVLNRAMQGRFVVCRHTRLMYLVYALLLTDHCLNNKHCRFRKSWIKNVRLINGHAHRFAVHKVGLYNLVTERILIGERLYNTVDATSSWGMRSRYI